MIVRSAARQLLPEPVVYFAVNVLLPAVKVGIDAENIRYRWLFADDKDRTLCATEAPMVVEPDTSNPMIPDPVPTLHPRNAPNITIAFVPVVAVTDGPTVGRSPNVRAVGVNDSSVATVAVPGVRIAPAFAPVDTHNWLPAVANAGAVISKLSRTLAFH